MSILKPRGPTRSPDGTHDIAFVFSDADRNESLTLAILGTISFASTVILGAYLTATAFGCRSRCKARRQSVRTFFQTDFGAYLGSLLVLHSWLATGFIANFVFAAAGEARQGPLCDYSGFTTLAGAAGPPLFNCALSFQTFWTFVAQRTTPRWLKWVVIASNWILLLLFGIVGSILQHLKRTPFTFFGPGLECSVRAEADDRRTFFAAIVATNGALLSIAFLLYSATALRLARNALKHKTDEKTDEALFRKQLRNVALKMMSYPLLYIAVTLPTLIRITMLGSGSGAKSPPQIFTSSLLASSGWLEVVLFLWTRPALTSLSGFSSILSVAHLGSRANLWRRGGIQETEAAAFVELEHMYFYEVENGVVKDGS